MWKKQNMKIWKGENVIWNCDNVKIWKFENLQMGVIKIHKLLDLNFN